MNTLVADRQLARDMGEAAWQSAPAQSWDADRRTSARSRVRRAAGAEIRTSRKPVGLPPLVQTPQQPVRVLVTDNQVLEPAVGGARVRVKEICKELSEHFPTEYIGAYDWPGPPSTDEWPLPNWHCRVLALSSGAIQTGGVAAEVRTRWLGHRRQLFVDDAPLARVRASAA